MLGDDLLLQLLQKDKAVHPRHDHVQQHQVAFSLPDIFQPQFSGIGQHDLVIVLQNRPEPLRLYRAVINNQYFFLFLHVSTPRI